MCNIAIGVNRNCNIAIGVNRQCNIAIGVNRKCATSILTSLDYKLQIKISLRNFTLSQVGQSTGASDSLIKW